MRSLEQIKTSGRVTYAWMGVSLQTLTSDIAGMFDVDSQGGALVEAVSPDSPAAKAGLRGGDQSVTVQGQPFTLGGDVIIKVDSTDIRTADDLIAYLGTKKPGDTVKVTVERDGRTEELSVTLAERPGNL
jgi:S1-C subfamily serine protease